MTETGSRLTLVNDLDKLVGPSKDQEHRWYTDMVYAKKITVCNWLQHSKLTAVVNIRDELIDKGILVEDISVYSNPRYAMNKQYNAIEDIEPYLFEAAIAVGNLFPSWDTSTRNGPWEITY